MVYLDNIEWYSRSPQYRCESLLSSFPLLRSFSLLTVAIGTLFCITQHLTRNMFLSQPFLSLLLLPAALRGTLAELARRSTACNNSPQLCDQAYNDVTYLGAHDSPFVRDDSTGFSASGNQFYNSTIQLSAGVRLLTAQVQLNGGALHVCQSVSSLFEPLMRAYTSCGGLVLTFEQLRVHLAGRWPFK